MVATRPTATDPEKVIAEAELMALSSDARVEVIDGELVEMNPVGGEHHDITGNIYDILKLFAKANRLGRVYMDGLLYLMNRKSGGLRGAFVPDVSYIARASIPKDWDRKKPFPGAPTLAVEVVSPGDDSEMLLKKVRTYLKSGTAQVWVVYPDTQEIHQYRADTPHTVKVYTGDAVMVVADLLPGLTTTASMCFELPDLGE